MLRRTTILASILALTVLGPVAGLAAPPSPTAPASADAKNRDAGQISGTIASVDYQNAVITLNAGSRGKVDVVVLPSTQIEGKDGGYHGISDLKAGTHVDVYASESGGRLTAQIIKIK